MDLYNQPQKRYEGHCQSHHPAKETASPLTNIQQQKVWNSSDNESYTRSLGVHLTDNGVAYRFLAYGRYFKAKKQSWTVPKAMCALVKRALRQSWS